MTRSINKNINKKTSISKKNTNRSKTKPKKINTIAYKIQKRISKNKIVKSTKKNIKQAKKTVKKIVTGAKTAKNAKSAVGKGKKKNSFLKTAAKKAKKVVKSAVKSLVKNTKKMVKKAKTTAKKYTKSAVSAIKKLKKSTIKTSCKIVKKVKSAVKSIKGITNNPVKSGAKVISKGKKLLSKAVKSTQKSVKSAAQQDLLKASAMPLVKNISFPFIKKDSKSKNDKKENKNNKEAVSGSTIPPEIIHADSETKLKYLFPNGVPKTPEEVKPYLTEVEVPLTKKDGTKTTGTIVTHKALAKDVQEVFQIAQDSGFKIYDIGKDDVGGYAWRDDNGKSHHSYGIAIDINPWQNYRCDLNGKPLSKYGKFWDPSQSEYSIDPNSELVKAFKERGWSWGGDWKNSKDYMHFSFTGE